MGGGAYQAIIWTRASSSSRVGQKTDTWKIGAAVGWNLGERRARTTGISDFFLENEFEDRCRCYTLIC